MNHFHYQNNDLMCEQVSVAQVAREVGTPVYVYSEATLRRHFHVFRNAFAAVPHRICYSVKANSTLAILRLLQQEGAGFDIVSGGELFRVLQAGADPQSIVYSGVGKSRSEIRAALEAGILMFNVESPQELEAISEVATDLGATAQVALRINPDVDPQTHAYISTGMKTAKFGIDITQARDAYRTAAKLPGIRIVGVDCHIGSQLTSIAPFIDAIKRIRALVQALRTDGHDIRYLDLGGGLGITYKDESPPSPADYAEAIIDITEDLGVELIFEPGRAIAGNAGRLITQVLYVKQGDEKNFVITDAAMNDLLRPTLYGAYHEIAPVQNPERDTTFVADVVGPICESGDYLARDRTMAQVAPGELLAVASAGAYGFTMSSNYNSRPRAAEVLICDDNYVMIRQRESHADLIRGEQIPAHLND